MSGFARVPLGDLVIDERPKRSSGDSPVWNLNLDQIEPDTGRVLERVWVKQDELGPSTYPFDAETVLYSKLRPYLNKVVVADRAGHATTELVPLRCDRDKVFPPYLAYFLRSADFLAFATAVVAGAKMPRMVMSEFWKYEAPVPPLSEQRRIAAILDKADALRTKRREALAQLDRLAQAIFVEMFGDPVTNPKAWPQVTLGELIANGPQNGLYKPSSVYGSGILILRIDGFYDGAVTGLASLKRVKVDAKELEIYGLHEGEIVINRVNSPAYLGKSALIPALTEPVVFESNMMRIVLKTERAQPNYVISFLQTAFIKAQIRTASKDAINQSSINQQDVKGFCINLPPLTLQSSFSEQVAAVERLRTRVAKASEHENSLFNSLQHRAFRGEL